MCVPALRRVSILLRTTKNSVLSEIEKINDFSFWDLMRGKIPLTLLSRDLQMLSVEVCRIC